MKFEVIGLVILVFFTIIYIMSLALELIKNFRNPRPLMDNGGPRFSDVKKEKTRIIL